MLPLHPVAKLLPRPTKPNPFCRSSPSSSPSLCLCLCISSLYLSTNPSSFSTLLVVSSFSIPHTALYIYPRRYRYHIRSISVPFKQSDRFRLSYSTENRKSSRPLFPRTNTHARVQHTDIHPIDQTLSSLSFNLLLPPTLSSFNRSFQRDQRTPSFCFIIS